MQRNTLFEGDALQQMIIQADDEVRELLEAAAVLTLNKILFRRGDVW
jgi:hypothetical protein